jgi:hypothetical protein
VEKKNETAKIPIRVSLLAGYSPGPFDDNLLTLLFPEMI